MLKKENVLNLYSLIDQYLSGKVDETKFCNQFFELYDMTIDVNDLTSVEKKVFDSLNVLVGDFFEYDKKKHLFPDSIIIQKLKQEVKNVKYILMQQDIYENDDKHKIYWLIYQYMIGNIDESAFCDGFYKSYDLGINCDSLNEIEKVAFRELDEIASRFSPYEEDHLLDPKAFSTIKELRQKIIETDILLKTQNHFNK